MLQCATNKLIFFRFVQHGVNTATSHNVVSRARAEYNLVLECVSSATLVTKVALVKLEKPYHATKGYD